MYSNTSRPGPRARALDILRLKRVFVPTDSASCGVPVTVTGMRKRHRRLDRLAELVCRVGDRRRGQGNLRNQGRRRDPHRHAVRRGQARALCGHRQLVLQCRRLRERRRGQGRHLDLRRRRVHRRSRGLDPRIDQVVAPGTSGISAQLHRVPGLRVDPALRPGYRHGQERRAAGIAVEGQCREVFQRLEDAVRQRLQVVVLKAQRREVRQPGEQPGRQAPQPVSRLGLVVSDREFRQRGQRVEDPRRERPQRVVVEVERRHFGEVGRSRRP